MREGGLVVFFFFWNDEKITAMTLANYVLEKAKESNIDVTNMKLQKILYYVQGHFLAKFNRPLFPDEIQAWKFGPVVPNVYYQFSPYGSEALFTTEKADMSSCAPEEIDLINSVIEKKLKLSARTLMLDTHNELPWMQVTQNGTRIEMNAVIDTDLIKQYFMSLEN